MGLLSLQSLGNFKIHTWKSLIDQFRFQHFATFAKINDIEQHCFWILLRSKHYGVSHKCSKLLKPAKNKYTWWCDFTIFSNKFLQIYIIIVFCDCICKSKTFQTVGCIWMISHFTQFFILIPGWFLSFETTMMSSSQLSKKQQQKERQIFWLKIRRALCDWSDKCLLTMAWQVFSLAMLNSSQSIYKTEVCWEKVRADIFENCNQKCQEGVRS